MFVIIERDVPLLGFVVVVVLLKDELQMNAPKKLNYNGQKQLRVFTLGNIFSTTIECGYYYKI
jgi:hypothetical protein